jgi:uncharacterized protein YceK
MKRLFIIFLTIFLISGCATTKHTRELRRKSKDCNCAKQHQDKKNKTYKGHR